MAVVYDNYGRDRRPSCRSKSLFVDRMMTRDLDGDLFGRVMPRPDESAIMAAQRAITSSSDRNTHNHTLSRSRSHSRNSVRDGRRSRHHPSEVSECSRDDLTEREFGIDLQSPIAGLSPRPKSPEKELVESQDRPPLSSHSKNVPVPRRMSSLPEESRVQVHHMSAFTGTQSTDFAREVPREEDETEGEGEGEEKDSGIHLPIPKRRGSASVRTRSPQRPLRSASSATPPPIGKPRTGTAIYEDDSDNDSFRPYEQMASASNHANEWGVMSDVESSSRRSRERKQPKMSNSTPGRYHSGSLTAASMRPPTLDRTQSHRDFEPKRADHEEVLAHYDPRFARSDETGSIITATARSHAGRRRADSDVDETMSISKHSISRHSAVSGMSSQMPDFFGPGIFQVVLHNPATAHQLLKFSESRLCSENVEFLAKVDQYHNTLNDLASNMAAIHKNFISNESTRQLNVSGNLIKHLHHDMRSHVQKTLPYLEGLFTEMQHHVEQTVYTDIYPRFVRHQLTLSATRALASDRQRYQGLGDCFCLTSPSKADNPILFASDGFVKVTGYTRPEIIPRNCRFLQGPQTDRAVVRRIKNAVNEGKESVELLLNYKKNGNPFWNLLYCAPLFDAQGRLAFFLGGQVNCSTTIHSNTDVMKVLSASGMSEEAEETEALMKVPQKQARHVGGARRALLRAFGVKVGDDTPQMPPANAGMENTVLGRMEGQDLAAQMKEFYTAYSKYVIIRADTFAIHFFSSGIEDMLNPANNPAGGSGITGAEIFRFLRQNMAPNHQGYHLNDVKQRVRNAIRMGHPISAEVRLATRRSAVFNGDEKFVTHWTPVKDENANTVWVVITLAPSMMML